MSTPFEQQPLWQFLLIQVLSGAIVLAMLWVLGGAWATVGWAILLQGGVALVAAIRLRVAVWWWPIHAGFVPGIALVLASGISPWWGLAGFLLLALVFRDVARTRVPLFLSSVPAQRAVAALIRGRAAKNFIDLGCGNGRMLRSLAQNCPDCALYGVESSPVLWLIARLNTWRWRQRCHVYWGNLWDQPLNDIEVIYAYLSPAPMPRLWQKVATEVKSGLFVSNTFGVPDFPADEIIPLDDAMGAQLLLWEINRQDTIDPATHPSL